MIGTAFSQDIRYTLRLLRHSPAFTIIAVSSLALGIGANTAIFTLVDTILLRSLPVQNAEQLVLLARNPSQPTTASNYPDYLYFRDHSRSYSGLIAFWSGGITTFTEPGRNSAPELISLALVSGNYFGVLGVSPIIGRVFNSADNLTPGAHPYVVLSYAFWKRRFGGDTGVIGRDILLNGARLQIVGVAREGFAGTNIGVAPDVFAPIIMQQTFWRNQATALTTRHAGWVTVMGRLKPGVARARAEAELNLLCKQIDPRQNEKHLLLPGATGESYLRRRVSRPLLILFIASGFLLLIACANVATLLLGRGLARRKEIAVRLAVGARRSRLIVQMVIESLVLSGFGGLAALFLAWWSLRFLLLFLPNEAPAPLALDLSPDLRLFSFGFALTMLSGLAFGLAPALRASAADPLLALKASAAYSLRRPGWDAGRALVSVQVALSLLLLCGAVLFTRSLANLRAIDPGLFPGKTLLVDTNMVQTAYQPQPARLLFNQLLRDTQRLPGVRAASIAAIIPFDDRWPKQVQIEGYAWKPGEQRVMDTNAVAPRYFEAVGIPVLEGRDFQESDNADVLPNLPADPGAARIELDTPGPPRVAIVNEAFARRFFAGRSPLGRRLCIGENWIPARTYRIAGVVGDAHYHDLREVASPMVYRPIYRDMDWSGGILCIHTKSDPHQIIGAIRRRLHELDPILTVTEAHTLQDNIDRALVPERFIATLGGFFGALALVLAAIGLYGVMAQAVARRTREIGIRMALGATQENVLWMVVRDSFTMVSIGAAVGLAASFVMTRYTESLLFGVQPLDPLSITVVLTLLLMSTGIAGFLPARRATLVQPMEVLRQE